MRSPFYTSTRNARSFYYPFPFPFLLYQPPSLPACLPPAHPSLPRTLPSRTIPPPPHMQPAADEGPVVARMGNMPDVPLFPFVQDLYAGSGFELSSFVTEELDDAGAGRGSRVEGRGSRAEGSGQGVGGFRSLF